MSRGAHPVLSAGFLLLAAAGCAARMDGARVAPGTPAGPGETWKPPADMPPPPPSPAPSAGSAAPAAPSLPPELRERATELTLPDLINVALLNNTLTRQTWGQARAAAANLGSERGSVWPTINLDTSANSSRFVSGVSGSSGRGGGTGTPGAGSGSGAGAFSGSPRRLTTYGPNLILSWLLWDSGGREADIEAARQALIAADWTHNQTIQDVVLSVQMEYFRYLGVRALLAAQQASVKESQTAFDAANARHEAGVATIADVLQAKTSLSQALLTEQELEGQVQVIRGSLVTALGLPASAAASGFDVAPLRHPLPVAEVLEDVDAFIARAETERPDLAAARSRVAENEARIRSARSASRPSLFTNANLGRTFFTGGPDPNDSATNYSAALTFRIPVWNGGQWAYNRLRAEADTDTSRAALEELRQRVILDVWTSFTDVQTETRRVSTAGDLLESAVKSEEVASGRYKAGVGNILDLLTAQRQLTQARASEVLARMDWAMALARLAHDTGAAGLGSIPGVSLEPGTEPAPPSTPSPAPSPAPPPVAPTEPDPSGAPASAEAPAASG